MLRRCLLLALLLAPACVRELPALPAAGEACDSDADCARDGDDAARGCGFQRLCIAGRCEIDRDASGGSQLVVCGDAAPIDVEADAGDE